MKEDVTYYSIEEKVDSHPSESPREATQILCSIITEINTVDPAQARFMHHDRIRVIFASPSYQGSEGHHPRSIHSRALDPFHAFSRSEY